MLGKGKNGVTVSFPELFYAYLRVSITLCLLFKLFEYYFLYL